MATLGVGTYGARLHWRGGGRVFGQLEGIAALSWERTLDDTGQASVTIAKRDADARLANLLGIAEPWIHELSIYRDEALIWQGPVVTIDESRTQVVIEARDVTAWLDYRTNHQPINYPSMDLTDIALALVRDGLGPDDPELLAWLEATPTGIVCTRVNEGTGSGDDKQMLDVAQIADELRQVSEMGLDFTAVGRRILLMPEASATTPAQARLTDADFIADLLVRRDGLDTMTRPVIQGQDNSGSTQVTESYGGTDPYFGLLERITQLQRTVDTASALATAKSYWTQLHHPPLIVVVPDDARLAPSAPVTIAQLVPGQRIDVAISGYYRPVRTGFRLSSVAGSWDNSGEAITVSMAQLGGLPDQPTTTTER